MSQKNRVQVVKVIDGFNIIIDGMFRYFTRGVEVEAGDGWRSRKELYLSPSSVQDMLNELITNK